MHICEQNNYLEWPIVEVKKEEYRILQHLYQYVINNGLFLSYYLRKHCLRGWNQMHGGGLDVPVMKMESTAGEMFWNWINELFLNKNKEKLWLVERKRPRVEKTLSHELILWQEINFYAMNCKKKHGKPKIIG